MALGHAERREFEDGIAVQARPGRYTQEEATARRKWWESFQVGQSFVAPDERAMRTYRSLFRYYCLRRWGHDGQRRRARDAEGNQTAGIEVCHWPVYTWRKLADGRYRCWMVSAGRWEPVEPTRQP